MIDYGLWIRGGRTCQGVFNTSRWPEGKPPAEARKCLPHKKEKMLVPMAHPKESRYASQRIPCTNVDKFSESIHKIVLSMPDNTKKVIICLYIRGMEWKNACYFLDLTSRQVGALKYKALKTVDSVLQ